MILVIDTSAQGSGAAVQQERAVMPVKFLVCVHEVLPGLDWKLEVVGLDPVVPKVDLEGICVVIEFGIDLAPIPNVLIELRASAAPLMSRKAATTAKARNIIISCASTSSRVSGTSNVLR
jgi:hypothetical protein